MQLSKTHRQTAPGRINRTLSRLLYLAATTGTPATTLAAPTPIAVPSPYVNSTSECPAGAEVEQEIVGLAPTLRQSRVEVRIQISDTGAEYTVDVIDPKLRAQKSFFDPARDCKRRARFVAVFVVLTLMPPGFDMPSTDVAPEAPPTQSPDKPSTPEVSPGTLSPSTQVPEKPPSPSVGRQRVQSSSAVDDGRASGTPQPRLKSTVRVEGALVLQWTPAVFQSLEMTSIGGEARGLFGRGRLAALVSIGYIKRSTFSAEGIHGSMRRMPAVVGAQWRTRLSRIEFETELGAVAMFERVRGNGFVHSEQNSTVQFGARLGAVVSSAQGRLVPYFGAYVSAFPLRQELLAAPQGVVGKTPTLDLSITLGGSYAF
jgi:hypothetical protein